MNRKQAVEENRSSLRKMLQSLVFTPYNWQYTLQLPRYLARPGKANDTGIERPPLSQTIDSEKNVETTIVAGGDIIQTRNNEPPRFDETLQTILGKADTFVANCEAPVLANDTAKERIIRFGMPASYLDDILAQVPVPNSRCVLSVASNHSRDQEEPTFRQGVGRIKDELGAQPVGLHTADDKPYTVIESSGLRFGIVAWTHLMNGEKVLPPRRVVHREDVVQTIDWSQVKEAEDIDVLIGVPHWDRSYQHFPHERTRRFARELVQNGFDLLLGSHPHVVQPLEMQENSLCMYSRGNLASKHYLSYETRLRPFIEIGLSSDGDIVEYKVHHFAQHRDEDGLALLPITKLPDKTAGKYQELIRTVFDVEPSTEAGLTFHHE